MFEMVSIMRFTAVEISKKSKRAKQTAFSKNFKSLQIIYTLFAHDVHYAYDAHHRSRNFENVEMCTTNSSFEKFEITVNLIYTVCAMSEMIM